MRLRLQLSAAFGKMLFAGMFTGSACLVQAQTQIDSAKLAPPATFEITNGATIIPAPGNLPKAHVNHVPLRYVSSQPYISLQQLLKGNAAGTYVQESTGEPGTEQPIFIRGVAAPLLSKRELYDQQAVVYLNGVPLTQDNPFAYEIQKYDFNRIGTATNLLATINPSNIASIEVIKDPVTLASLGPLAANGVIWITTKNAHSGFRQISVNAYAGVAGKPAITPVNAAYENNFRLPFYDKYGTVNDRLNYAPYLRDSTNADYYGPATWTDLYFSNPILFSTDLSLTGGSDRANFRFFTSATKNASSADATNINRYTGSFFINVAPIKWLMVSSMINYNRMERTRNRNIRDRLAEQRYIPDLTNPLTPNKNRYQSYLNEFDKVIDDNASNVIQGYVAISANINKIKYNGRIAFDYNEGIRDAFSPATLLEGNNFVSSYFGYNQRFIASNTLGYEFGLGNNQKLFIEGGQNFQADIYKFDYAFAYNGPNDFIKINVVNGDASSSNYLLPTGFAVYYFPSKMQTRLASFFGNATYTLGNALKINAVVRRDGSSNMQPDNRWYTSYSAGAEWNIKQHLLAGSTKVNDLSLSASWGRLGKLLSDDRFNAGPHYRVDLGWGNEPTLGSYAGIPGLSRPYTSGWVGYGIPWAYADRINVGVRYGTWNNRLKLALDLYNRDDKNQLLPVPVAAEWGYTGAYKTGMAVQNRGIDLTLAADLFPAGKNAFNWTFTANFNYNKNKLKALPGGLSELIIGNTMLSVGQPVDGYWLYQNTGIYNSDSEVPVNPQTNKPLTFQGVPLKAGDPKWTDVNGDFVINNKDKVLKGSYLPKLSGGFGSTIGYKALSLDFQFYVSLGRKVLNQYAASRLDFINTEVKNDINSVKEITFWQKKMDLISYPMYNPWSAVVPYRLEQDLFLDDASFLKLRTVSISYDFTKTKHSLAKAKKRFQAASIYLTATNLFTITSFKGDDPELVNYNGVYTGYGLPLTQSLIAGFKLSL
ncbi:MAG: SusC/RagA family TonB-linked outer membrane protein [Bacteroidota bacterium]